MSLRSRTKRLLSSRSAAALASFVAAPAFAHISGGATPHWHREDAWGVLAVLGLTALAAWLDRRWR